jgi:tRNA A-37 threonylcarbamoyl transferase component Bud32
VSEAAEDRARALLGKTLGGKYFLETLIGQGAMGAVFRARGPSGRKVAVKTLSAELMRSDAAQRFVRESEVVRGLQHPHVVPTLDAGVDAQSGLLFLVMPLQRGRNLDHVLDELGALEPENAVRIALQAAKGLGAAHRIGVIHRDVKPGNLILDEEDQEIVVRVCDFGIAKRLGGAGSLTSTGTQLGTPDYVSPEQLKSSKSVDERADVWSLGATLYQMLCGEPPFAHVESVFDLMTAIMTEDPYHLQDRAPWIDGSLALVVHKSLRRDPKQRWKTLRHFADALRPFAGGDERLDASRIQAASKRTRSKLAPRVDLKDPLKQPSLSAKLIAVTKSQALRVQRGGLGGALKGALIAGLASAAIAGGVVLYATGHDLESARVAAVEAWEWASGSVPKAPQSGVTEVTARVLVVPDAAKVTTRDGPIPVVNGEVLLRGLPGETLEVELEYAGAKSTFSVSIGDDGLPTPSRLVLTP